MDEDEKKKVPKKGKKGKKGAEKKVPEGLIFAQSLSRVYNGFIIRLSKGVAMPRRKRMYLSGFSYHLVQRGNNREACFVEPENYQFYLKLWKD